MAEKTPVRINYDSSNNAIGFAEFQADEFIGWLELNNVWGIKINNSN